MIGILAAVLLATLVFVLCEALGVPSNVGMVTAVLVLLAGVGTGRPARSDWGDRRL